MKKILFVLFAFLLALTNVVHADQVKTKLAPPFQTLNIDTQLWSLEFRDKSAIGFTLVGSDYEVDFDIFQGRVLKKVSLKKLKRQIHKAKGNLSKVSLLKSSFPQLEDSEDEESTIDFENGVEIMVNGIQGLKFHVDHFVREVELTNDGENIISETIYPGLGYIFVTENRIYIMSFNAPPEKFSDLEPLFEETVQHLFTHT